jgi:hypothetical protein
MLRGQVLSIQISYHPGWTASVNGRSVPVRSDGIGLIVVDPGCEGECRVDLAFTGGVEAATVQIVSYGALVAGLAWIAGSYRRRHV